MARPKKEEREQRINSINVRTTDDMADEFKAAVDVIGSKMSDELHRHMVEVIRRAKALDPVEFESRRKAARRERLNRRRDK